MHSPVSPVPVGPVATGYIWFRPLPKWNTKRRHPAWSQREQSATTPVCSGSTTWFVHRLSKLARRSVWPVGAPDVPMCRPVLPTYHRNSSIRMSQMCNIYKRKIFSSHSCLLYANNLWWIKFFCCCTDHINYVFEWKFKHKLRTKLIYGASVSLICLNFGHHFFKWVLYLLSVTETRLQIPLESVWTCSNTQGWTEPSNQGKKIARQNKIVWPFKIRYEDYNVLIARYFRK
jgi:hypothetical protein